MVQDCQEMTGWEELGFNVKKTPATDEAGARKSSCKTRRRFSFSAAAQNCECVYLHRTFFPLLQQREALKKKKKLAGKKKGSGHLFNGKRKRV